MEMQNKNEARVHHHKVSVRGYIVYLNVNKSSKIAYLSRYHPMAK